MAGQVGAYRIRWANVQHSNGLSHSTQRMCIAERRYRFFGWWPATDAHWRFDERDAQQDIERDHYLRSPLPPPRIICPTCIRPIDEVARKPTRPSRPSR